MHADIFCGKCNSKITNMKMLKPIRDIVKSYGHKCPSCGHTLSSEFIIDITTIS